MLYGFHDLADIDDYCEAHIKRIANARKNLSAEMDVADTRDLVSGVHTIIELEAELRVLELAEFLINERDLQNDVVYRSLLETFVLPGADDAWSGRTNDAKRVAFDAQRKLVQGFKYLLIP